jgi:hypothetical protein
LCHYCPKSEIAAEIAAEIVAEIAAEIAAEISVPLLPQIRNRGRNCGRNRRRNRPKYLCHYCPKSEIAAEIAIICGFPYENYKMGFYRLWLPRLDLEVWSLENQQNGSHYL